MLPVTVHLACDALGNDVHVLRASGREAMNELSRWTIEVLSTGGELPMEAALGAPATLTLADDGEGSFRSIGLIVAEIAFEAEGRDGLHYVLDLAPGEHLMTLRSGYRVFLEKTAQEILAQVLEDAGTPGARIAWRLAGAYGTRPHCTQYGETEWAFVERLLAEEGISYWFDQTASGPTLVFGDAMSGHDGIEAPVLVSFQDPSGMVQGRSFHAFELTREPAIESVFLRDYDVRHPDVHIDGAAGEGPLQVFEYPAGVADQAAAKARAEVRLEQLQRWKTSAAGQSDCARIAPGRLIEIEGTNDDEMNRKYLIVRVVHTYARAAHGEGGDDAAYENRAVLVPADGPAHRPAVPAQAPRVEGIEPAITTGPGSEDIHVNDLGEVKIRFPWDRSGIFDDRSSAWVRCLSMGMDGAMLLPRVGWEVPVAYFDGNPDRPLVLGRVYNAQSVVPYGLPSGKTTTTLQSATSPGGGSTNEIRMGDSAGSMEMFVHASKDQSVAVGGTATTTVAVDETHDVTLSYAIDVTASQTHTVGASQTVNVGTDAMARIKGGRSETVGALETHDITANRVCNAKGAYTEMIGAIHGVQCNQANTDVKGGYTQLIGASLAQGAGLGTSESVAGARGQTVGGARNIVAAKGFGENVLGPKAITAGTSSVKAGGSVMTASKTSSGTIHVGGSAKITAAGPVVIAAKSITLDISGSLTAEALSLSGGTLKITRGTTSIMGTIKREGGTEIE